VLHAVFSHDSHTEHISSASEDVFPTKLYDQVTPLWWGDCGQLPSTHPATLSLPLVNRTWGENRMKKLMG